MRKLLVTFELILIIGCSKSDISIPTETQLDCTEIGLGATHTFHSECQDILDEYVKKGFSGMTALVYTPDEGLWIGSSGKADVKNNIAMANCNSFFSGSVAKVYTVAAAMALYENGLLDLDAPISNYLPQTLIDNLPNAQTATIKQLMNHSAGMPDHDNEAGLDNYIETHNGSLPSPVEQLSYLFDNEPNFEAGTNYEYSSAHTVALALVLDSISGQSHANLITDKIINKIGLQETYYKNEIGYPNPTNLVRGYLEDGSDITQPAINYAEGSYGDAGVIATANDYYLFMQGLVNGGIINSDTLNTMLDEPFVVNDGTHGFGFGLGLFFVSYENEIVKYGHGGQTLGGMSHVYYYPKKNSYLVILTNTLIEENITLMQDWAGSVLVKTGNDFLIDKFEKLILD